MNLNRTSTILALSVSLILPLILVFLFAHTPAPNSLAADYTIDTACNPGSHSTYDVGPGKPYQTLGSVPWMQLTAGDTVRLFYRPEPYQEKIILTNSGTEGNPITFCGVPGPNGELPILDGNNAVTSNQFQIYASNTIQTLGVVVFSLGNNDPGQFATGKPKYWEVKNLEVKNGDATHTYKDMAGATQTYSTGAAGIYIWRGDHIHIHNVSLHDNGNGFFVNSPDDAHISHDILLEGSYIYNNGTVGGDHQHNIYTEASGIIFQYNHIGPLRDGSGGSDLKDRSAGLIIRYNWFEGGAHLLDLVDTENASPGMTQEPNYRNTFVYGNVLINPNSGGAASLIHFGGDTGAEANYRTNLYFFDNTLINSTDHTHFYRVVVFKTSTTAQTVHANNNIFYNIAPSGAAAASELDLISSGNESGSITFGTNWVSPGWVLGATNGTYTGTATGVANLISPSNNNPGFVGNTPNNFDPHLTASSTANGRAIGLPAEFASYPVANQYKIHQASENRASTKDLGAFEYSASSSATSTPSPTGTATTSATISLVKSADKLVAQSGDTITYTITYQNTSATPAQHVLIRDVIPSGSVLVATPTGASLSGTTLSWAIDNLPGESQPQSVSFQVKVK